MPPGDTRTKCYMAELGSCAGPISGEHLISRSVIDILASEGAFSISGLPWLADGETRFIGPSSLTAKCLCRAHNSALSDLDDAAKQFFNAVKHGLTLQAKSATFVVSGHDLERWLLKTAKAMAASGNLTQGRQKISGAFPKEVDVIRLLDDPLSWDRGAGLYCIMPGGATTQNDLRFQLSPLVTETGELFGIGVSILGLEFALALENPSERLPELVHAKYRPGKITIQHPKGTDIIHLSWEDGLAHLDSLKVAFLRSAG